MKKIFAMLLAVIMVMLMASVSFASLDKNSVVALEGPFDYEAEDRQMRDPRYLEFGRTAYYLLYMADENDSGAIVYKPVTDREYVEKLKVKVEYEMGKNLVESVAVVKKRIDVSASDSILKDHNYEDGYYYAIAIEIEDRQTTSDADIIGTLTFDRKKIDINDDDVIDPYEEEIDDEEFDFDINVFYGEYDYLNNSSDMVVSDDIDIEDDQSYALKFDSDDEVEFTFGNDATFIVDVSGQNKLYMKWDSDSIDEIVDANPNAVIDFMNFHDVKFNRVGEFTYEMEDIEAVYKVVDGKLVEISNAEFDDDEVIFRTRTLENYVFSTRKLVTPAPEVEVVIPSAPIVSNPNTGVEL